MIGVSVTPTRTVMAQSFGSILSPQYPSSYGNNINSVLTVQVPPGFMMTMWSDNFNMECKLTYLQRLYTFKDLKRSLDFQIAQMSSGCSFALALYAKLL